MTKNQGRRQLVIQFCYISDPWAAAWWPSIPSDVWTQQRRWSCPPLPLGSCWELTEQLQPAIDQIIDRCEDRWVAAAAEDERRSLLTRWFWSQQIQNPLRFWICCFGVLSLFGFWFWCFCLCVWNLLVLFSSDRSKQRLVQCEQNIWFSSRWWERIRTQGPGRLCPGPAEPSRTGWQRAAVGVTFNEMTEAALGLGGERFWTAAQNLKHSCAAAAASSAWLPLNRAQPDQTEKQLRLVSPLGWEPAGCSGSDSLVSGSAETLRRFNHKNIQKVPLNSWFCPGFWLTGNRPGLLWNINTEPEPQMGRAFSSRGKRPACCGTGQNLIAAPQLPGSESHHHLLLLGPVRF